MRRGCALNQHHFAESFAEEKQLLFSGKRFKYCFLRRTLFVLIVYMAQNLDLLFISVPNSQLLLRLGVPWDVPYIICLKAAESVRARATLFLAPLIFMFPHSFIFSP